MRTSLSPFGPRLRLYKQTVMRITTGKFANLVLDAQWVQHPGVSRLVRVGSPEEDRPANPKATDLPFRARVLEYDDDLRGLWVNVTKARQRRDDPTKPVSELFIPARAIMAIVYDHEDDDGVDPKFERLGDLSERPPR